MRLASLLRGLVLALALILAPVVPLSWATAQEAAAPDEATSADTPVEDVAPAFREIAGVNLDDWEAFAARVEAALETGRVSDSVLGDLRRDLVVWRDKFATAKDLSSVRIQALEAQIADLGTAPAEGETEPAAIAIQRDRLEAELECSSRVAAAIGLTECQFGRDGEGLTIRDWSIRFDNVPPT